MTDSKHVEITLYSPKSEIDDIPDIGSSEIDKMVADQKDKRCAPSTNFSDGSCLSVDILAAMAKNYNKMYPEKAIKLTKKTRTLNPKKYKRYLVKELTNRLSDVCDNQRCWVKQPLMQGLDEKMKEEAIRYSFRPKGPEGTFEWLNTLNINDVMDQYTKKHPEFIFLGAVPMDFDNPKVTNISNINYDQLVRRKKTKLGIVFNLDESWKSGSHWVGMYSDLERGQIYYFDSYGIQPEPRVRVLMRRIAKWMESRGLHHPDVNFNNKRYQYGGSECGVYSIHFILRMLNGESFKDIKKRAIPDEEITKFRKLFFT